MHVASVSLVNHGLVRYAAYTGTFLVNEVGITSLTGLDPLRI